MPEPEFNFESASGNYNLVVEPWDNGTGDPEEEARYIAEKKKKNPKWDRDTMGTKSGTRMTTTSSKKTWASKRWKMPIAETS